MLGVSMVEWGYLRTSKQQQAGMDPETQEHALVSACVPVEHVFRDVGISGTDTTMSKRGWRSLQGQLRRGDVVDWRGSVGDGQRRSTPTASCGSRASSSGRWPRRNRSGRAISTPTRTTPTTSSAACCCC